MLNAVGKAGVPEGIEFQTKPEIALQQIRQALEQEVAVGVILTDAGYGNSTPFRTALTQLGLPYMVGIESSTTLWEPGQQPLPAPPRKPGRGTTPKRLQRNPNHQPVTAKQLALTLPSDAGRTSLGARAVEELCALVSPLSACVPLIAITKGPSHTRKNGF